MPRPAHPWLRKGRGWFCTIDGKQVPLGNDEHAARVEFQRLTAQKGKAAKNATSAITVKGLLDAWIDSFQRSGNAAESQQTREQRQGFALSFIEFIGQLPVSQLQGLELTDWLACRASAYQTL